MNGDPYSFAGTRLLSSKFNEIRAFWVHFSAHADDLDKGFSGQQQDTEADPVDVMAALKTVEPELMWEFGPSDHGHNLCITAEWKHHLRPLARAVIDNAPNLPRWQFTEARTGTEPAQFEQHFNARFGTECIISSIECTVGRDNKINLCAHGQGAEDDQFNQTLMIAGLLLGEQADRDWFGIVDVAPNPKKGLMARLRTAAPEPFDTSGFLAQYQAATAVAHQNRSDQPLAKMDLDSREVTLLQTSQMPDQSRRPDMITFAVMQVSYGEAAIAETGFASINHSAFGEWFLFLRVPHNGQGYVDQRYEIEEALHVCLSKAGIGGTVAAGHGTDAYYIDIGTTDVDAALSLLAAGFANASWAADTTLHFLDAGLDGIVLPLSDLPTKPQ